MYKATHIDVLKRQRHPSILYTMLVARYVGCERLRLCTRFGTIISLAILDVNEKGALPSECDPQFGEL